MEEAGSSNLPEPTHFSIYYPRRPISGPDRYTGVPFMPAGSATRMYYCLYGNGELVGLIDLENRTFEYEGSHSSVEQILRKIDNEQYCYVVVVDTDYPTTAHFDVPKTGEELAQDISHGLELIDDNEDGIFATNDDPDDVSGERVPRDEISEVHPLRPPAEPSDFLVARQEKAENVDTPDIDEADIPDRWLPDDSSEN